MTSKPPQNIDSYLIHFPEETKIKLEQIRKLVKKLAPESEEAMKYGIPTFRLNNTNLVHFAGFAAHIGFYPSPSGIAAFKKELSAYKNAKGSVQFPLSEPLPLELISKIIEFRINEVNSK